MTRIHPSAVGALLSTLCILLALSQVAQAEVEGYGYRSGYLMDVKEERHLIIREMVLMQRPQRIQRRTSNFLINEKLKLTFRRQYEREFGRTQAVRNIAAPNSFADLEYENGVRVTPVEDVKRKRRFGEYMVKKLTEHHVDGFIRSNPEVRPIYELKERVSKVKMKVKRGYEVKFRYSFSGNLIRINVDNPYKLHNRVIFQMDREKFGPTSVEETLLYLRYPLNPTNSLALDYRLQTQAIAIVGERRMSPQLSTTVTGSKGPYWDPEESVTKENDYRLILGFTWNG